MREKKERKQGRHFKQQKYGTQGHTCHHKRDACERVSILWSRTELGGARQCDKRRKEHPELEIWGRIINYKSAHKRMCESDLIFCPWDKSGFSASYFGMINE